MVIRLRRVFYWFTFVLFLTHRTLKFCRTQISGGAQWKRMMDEIELFLRFSEMSCEIKKKDVIQVHSI